ncbi:MAG: ubiquinol-cytochrome c reductase iron-sulfur subunit [Gemmatimonadota bacterium]|nr:ubiquinol-cytochrome c reductase iron-sulfur subunit [Gemmatimonadota bacterium]
MAETGHDEGRRDFIDWLLGTSAAALALAVVYPVLRYIVPPEAAESAASSVTLDIGPDDLAPNSAEIFKFGSSPGILVKTPSGELRAFEATCTHLSCIVQYRDDISHIWCACHDGHFDLDGTNIQGPPPSPLEQYDVKVRGSQIVVSKRA